uniref:Uncharacterized protein n=1 Tax=Pseudonaja textilis TaxID=8673 RepID=A0A670YPV2_PSETE
LWAPQATPRKPLRVNGSIQSTASWPRDWTGSDSTSSLIRWGMAGRGHPHPTPSGARQTLGEDSAGGRLTALKNAAGRPRGVSSASPCGYLRCQAALRGLSSIIHKAGDPLAGNGQPRGERGAQFPKKSNRRRGGSIQRGERQALLSRRAENARSSPGEPPLSFALHLLPAQRGRRGRRRRRRRQRGRRWAGGGERSFAGRIHCTRLSGATAARGAGESERGPSHASWQRGRSERYANLQSPNSKSPAPLCNAADQPMGE